VLEVRGLYPQKLEGRRWGLGAGALAGAIGGAVGLPGPPVVLYAATQGWSARTVKANLQAFFVVNQGAILIGYWWAGLLTPGVWSLTLGFTLPAIAGAVAGALLFERVDQRRFRQLVFALILVSGLERQVVVGEHPRPVVLIVALDVRALLGDQESDARVGVGLGVGAVADHLVRRPLLRRRTPREGLRRHLGERRTKPRGAVGVLLN